MPSQELTAASAEPYILSLLAQGERHGYALTQLFSQSIKDPLPWKEGMLYPVLHRLECRGWVVAEWRISESGQTRKYYRLKPKGQKALAAFIAQRTTLSPAPGNLRHEPSS